MFRAELREQQKSLLRIRILKEEEELLVTKEKRVYQKIEHENNVKEHRKKMEILQSFAALNKTDKQNFENIINHI